MELQHYTFHLPHSPLCPASLPLRLLPVRPAKCEISARTAAPIKVSNEMRIMSIRAQHPLYTPFLTRILHTLPLLPLLGVLRVLPPIECQCRIRSVTSDRLRCRHLAPQSVLKCKVPSLFVRIVKFHLKQTTLSSSSTLPTAPKMEHNFRLSCHRYLYWLSRCCALPFYGPSCCP